MTRKNIVEKDSDVLNGKRDFFPGKKSRKNPSEAKIKEMKPPQIITIKKLLEKSKLTIPEYQRPYKWTIKNVNQLLDDIIHHNDKSAYRLGTLVLHEDEDGNYNIVDGQQRTITVVLIAHALQHELPAILKNELEKLHFRFPKTSLFEALEFTNNFSKKNIKENYLEIKRRITDLKPETIVFFFEQCQLVQVILRNVSEAFQFFDSQNARGVDLAPHDLLKAFHLREMMDTTTEQERIATVDKWENLDSDDLKLLFAEYLFRIRHWAMGTSARIFTKNEVDRFKGINPTIEQNFPFAHLYRISHFYIESYNSDYHRKIDKTKMDFPFQLDQVMINGKRFFEFVDYYWEIRKTMYIDLAKDDAADAILNLINSYTGNDRTGDQYVRNLFDCALLFYWDKFGKVEIGRAVEKIFIWAYSIRLKLYSVQLASVDNRATEPPYVFKTIKDSLHPKDVLNISIPALEAREVKREIEDLVKKFKELNYYND